MNRQRALSSAVPPQFGDALRRPPSCRPAGGDAVSGAPVLPYYCFREAAPGGMFRKDFCRLAPSGGSLKEGTPYVLVPIAAL